MRNNLAAISWRLTVFVIGCLVGMLLMVMVFGQMRFQHEKTYRAEFGNVTGLENGNFVRVAGVEVGKVKKITIKRDGTAVVEFSTDDSVVLTEGTRALIRFDNVISGRYLALEQRAGSVAKLVAGATIPVDRTEPALDLDALIGGFRPLFRALNPEQVNALTGQLISVFQGQGATIGSFLAQTAAVTNALADRDELIGEVITNLNTVQGALGNQSDQFAKAVDSLSQLIERLAQHKTDISTGVAYIDAAAGSITDLLRQGRPPIHDAIEQTGRAAQTVMADSAYFDDTLNTLPQAYQVLGRQGLYGDYFSFYACEILLKVNGKGGEPVYIKMASQTSGRCTPR